jgi:WD40 repeat protein
MDRWPRLLIWSLTAALALVASAEGQSQPKFLDQKYWEFDGGYLLDNGDGTVTERTAQGETVLKIVKRNPLRLQLRDEQTQRQLTLSADSGMQIEQPGRKSKTVVVRWKPVPESLANRSSKPPVSEPPADMPPAGRTAVEPSPADQPRGEPPTSAGALKPHSVIDPEATLVLALAFMADGKHLAIAPQEGGIQFHATERAGVVRSLPRFSGATTSMLAAGQPDELYAAEGFHLRHIHWQTGQELKSYGSGFGLARVAVPTAQVGVLAYGSTLGGVELIDMNRGESLVLFQAVGQAERRDEVRCSAVAVSPDGRLLAGARGSGEISLWDLRSKAEQPTRTLAGHTGQVESLWFGPDGLFSLGHDGRCLRWDSRSWESTVHCDGCGRTRKPASFRRTAAARRYGAETGARDRQDFAGGTIRQPRGGRSRVSRE